MSGSGSIEFCDGLAGFFFSSRRRHTRYWRDWSSDVCSSDLHRNLRLGFLTIASWFFYAWWDWRFLPVMLTTTTVDYFAARSEERRVGKECRSRESWDP